MEDWDGGLTGYTYDAAGQLITTTLPNDVTSVRQYDDADRLLRLTHTDDSQITLSDFQYTLDAVGNQVQLTETLTQATRVITNTYNPLGRLTGSEYSTDESFAYIYDAVGNRVLVTSTTPLSGTVITTCTYDVANRLTDQVRSDERAYTYTWSNQGQLLEEWIVGVPLAPVREFAYDGAGRMSQARVFTTTTYFTYNGDGARVKVRVGESDTTTYTLDYARGYQILAEEMPTNTIVYLYGYDCLGQFEDSEWLYFLNDAPGYVRQGVDEQGQIVSNWLFDPDGTLLEGPQSLVSHLICGGVYDWSTGLIYKNGRYFDPNLGIWLALAPLIVIQSYRGRKRKRRRKGFPWYVLMVLFLCVGMTATACKGDDTTPSPTSTGVCTPGTPPIPTPSPSPQPPTPTPVPPTPAPIPPTPMPPPEPTPSLDEKARVTCKEIQEADGTMENYLRSEEDAVLLTRLAMAESRQSPDDRIYVMWIVRLRTEIATMSELLNNYKTGNMESPYSPCALKG